MCLLNETTMQLLRLAPSAASASTKPAITAFRYVTIQLTSACVPSRDLQHHGAPLACYRVLQKSEPKNVQRRFLIFALQAKKNKNKNKSWIHTSVILQHGTSPHPSSGYKWGNQSAELHLKLVTLCGACVWIPRASGKTMWDDLKSTSQFYWQYIHFKGAEYGSWSDIKRLLNNSSGLIKRTCIDTDAVQREGEGVHKVHGRAFRRLCRISLSSETSYSRIKKPERFMCTPSLMS